MSVLLQKKETIVVWIDHSTEIQSVLNTLKEKHANEYGEYGPLSKFIKIDLVPIPDAVLSPPSVVSTKIREIYNAAPNLLLVDYAFGPHDDPRAREKGIEIARHLRITFPTSAVGLFTRLKFETTAEISVEGFDILLSNITSLVEYELSGDTWLRCFRRAIQQHRSNVSRIPFSLDLPESGVHVQWTTGHPLRDSYSLNNAARVLSSRILEVLDPRPQGTVMLEEFSGGFSGSYTIMATPSDRQMKWVFKLNEDPRKLQREIDGYNRFSSLVSGDYYPRLLTNTTTSPYTLAPDWWGAIAMQCELGVQPLVDRVGDLVTKELEQVYQRVWHDVLVPLYGPVSKRNMRCDQLMGPFSYLRSQIELQKLARYEEQLPMNIRKINDAYEAGKQIVTKGWSTIVSPDAELCVPWTDRIHGDLNCRNILLYPNSDRFKLIDFPRVGPGIACTDFAKAESELVLIMLDWAQGRDWDLQRMADWVGLTSSLSSRLLPDLPGMDQEMQKITGSCITLRGIYKDLVRDIPQAAEAYRLILLGTVLSYVGYLDVTMPKRLLALIWGGELSAAKWKG